MSRTKQGVKNFKISFFFLGISILLSFISRNIFIRTLGTDVMGLSSTLLNILGFLNLAELGLTSAIAGTLYKPIYENDREKIKDIISIFGYLYRIIGIVILVAGIVVSFFLPYFFDDSGVSLLYVYCGYYTFLSTSLIGYFISYRQTILSADQKEYVITRYMNIVLIVKVFLQIAVLKWMGQGYLGWLLVELVFGIIYGFWINGAVNKQYPWLKTSYARGKEVRKEYKGLFKTIKQVIPHNFGAFVLGQTDNILIYAFSSLTAVTLYTNYVMILTRSVTVINMSIKGLAAGFGNLVAEGNKDRIMSVFNQFNALFFILGGIIVVTFYFQTAPFVTLWLGREFILDDFTFWLMLYVTYVGVIRLPINYFIGGYVLYKDVWAPIVEAGLNLVVSLIFGYFWGVAGVVFGTAVSLSCIVVLWKPVFLFKEGFKSSSLKYWFNFMKYVVVLLGVAFIPFVLIKNDLLFSNNDFLGFVINSFAIVIIVGSIYTTILYFIDRGTKDILNRFGEAIFKRIIPFKSLF